MDLDYPFTWYRSANYMFCWWLQAVVYHSLKCQITFLAAAGFEPQTSRAISRYLPPELSCSPNFTMKVIKKVLQYNKYKISSKNSCSMNKLVSLAIQNFWATFFIYLFDITSNIGFPSLNVTFFTGGWGSLLSQF